MSGVEELTLENDINRAIELLNVLQKNPQLPTEKLDALKTRIQFVVAIWGHSTDFKKDVETVNWKVYRLIAV